MHTSMPRGHRPLIDGLIGTPLFRPTLKLLALFAVLIFMAIYMSGCAQLGLQKAQSPEDNLRYAQATVTGIYTTLGNAAEQKTIPAADARNYYNKVTAVKVDLDSADAVIRSIPTGGTVPADTVGKINLALTILVAIADELRSRLPSTATAAIPAKR